MSYIEIVLTALNLIVLVRIESVSGEISSKLHKNNYRYEKEYEILTQLWVRAVDIEMTFLQNLHKKDIAERSRKIIEFYRLLRENIPFCSPAIAMLLHDFYYLCTEISSKFGEDIDEDRKNIEKLWEKMSPRDCKIGERVELWDEMNSADVIEKLKTKVSEH